MLCVISCMRGEGVKILSSATGVLEPTPGLAKCVHLGTRLSVPAVDLAQLELLINY